MKILSEVRKSDSLLVMVNDSLEDLPSPSSLTYYWNFGSLLGVFLGFQILTGLFLSIHFSGNVDISFYSIIHMMRDVSWGWLIRVLHANGASFFFLLMYFHIGRGIYYGSYRYGKTWMSGVSILLLSMATAFLGYVLPWGQMSFWAATVITNLLSAIPYVGVMLVEWVWGGFAVGNPTLIRFFAFHFLFPFVIVFLVVIHLVFLHETGSGNPIGLSGNEDKIMFHPYYTMSDMYGFVVMFMVLLLITLVNPFIFMDVENFISSNSLVTPTHIQPEWYFLFAYTILRSIPSKIGGVMALVMSVLVYYLFPFLFFYRFRSVFFYYLVKYLFWIFVVNWLLLTWIGSCEVEEPFSILGVYFSILYFIMFFAMWIFYKVQDELLF